MGLSVGRRGGTRLMGVVSSSLDKGHRYPVEIISHWCVQQRGWLIM
jgi:hypothetical protein